MQSGCRLAIRLAGGRRCVDLIGQILRPPLSADGLPRFGVVAGDGILTDLLETGHGRLLGLELLRVELHLHHVRAGGLGRGGQEVVQGGLRFGQLEVLRLDGGVGVLEEGLGADAVVGVVATLHDVTGTTRATGGDADAPRCGGQHDDGDDQDPCPRLDAAGGPTLDLVVPLVFQCLGHIVSTLLCEVLQRNGRWRRERVHPLMVGNGKIRKPSHHEEMRIIACNKQDLLPP